MQLIQGGFAEQPIWCFAVGFSPVCICASVHLCICATLHCAMLTQLLCHYWRSITLADLLTAVYLVVLVLFVIGCNHLFTNFVDSKPEGRKTVLGQLTVEVTKIEVGAHPFLIPKFLNLIWSPARLKGTHSLTESLSESRLSDLTDAYRTIDRCDSSN